MENAVSPDAVTPRQLADMTGRIVSLTSDAQRIHLTEHISRRRELSRTLIAASVVGSLLFIVIGTFITIWTKKDATLADLREMVHILISPTIGVVGAVIGFYFGKESSYE